MMKIFFAFLLVACMLATCCIGCNQSEDENHSADTTTQDFTLCPIDTAEIPVASDGTTAPNAFSPTEVEAISDTTQVPSETETPQVGGPTSCNHTLMYDSVELDNSYHAIDSVLINYIGADKFSKWVAEMEKTKESNITCPFEHITIVKFVEDFHIPREVFEELNRTALNLQYDYNLDAIYGGKEIAERYYTGDRLQSILEKKMIRLFKSKLLDYVNKQDKEALSSWISKKNTTMQANLMASGSKPLTNVAKQFTGNLNQYSYIEFIKYFGVPQSVANTLFEESHSAYSACTRVIDINAVYADIAVSSSESATTNAVPISTTVPFESDISYLCTPSTVHK